MYLAIYNTIAMTIANLYNTENYCGGGNGMETAQKTSDPIV